MPWPGRKLMKVQAVDVPSLASANPTQWHVCHSKLSHLVGSAQGFAPTPVCRKCAVRFEPIRGNSRFFNTSVKCLRAGFLEGKSLKRVVSAEGIEPSTY